MIDVPTGLASQHIKENFSKGHVLYWENYEGSKENKNRYFVLLTPFKKEEFIVANATTQIHYYTDEGKRKPNDFVLIKGGVEVFPRDTVIDLSFRERFSAQELAELLGINVNKEGKLSDSCLNRIDKTVEGSDLISPKVKSRILE